MSVDPQVLTLSGLDVVVLLYHIRRSAEEFDHMDANFTLDQLTGLLNFKVRIPVSVVESGLYSCNMLSEQFKFWHPNKMLFEEFCRKVAGKRFKFNPKYNWLDEKESS